MKIAVKKIRLDGGTQPREGLDYKLIGEYMASMKEGAVFPPVILFYDGKEYWCADGFHRVWSVKNLYHPDGGEIEAQVLQGTQRDAILYSCSANATNGMRRTNDDKRRSVMKLLTDKEWAKWSNVEIAGKCVVDEGTVRRYRAQVETLGHTSEIPKYEKTFIHPKTGKPATMNTANIGKKKETPAAEVIRGIMSGREEQEEPSHEYEEPLETVEAQEKPLRAGVERNILRVDVGKVLEGIKEAFSDIGDARAVREAVAELTEKLIEWAETL